MSFATHSNNSIPPKKTRAVRFLIDVAYNVVKKNITLLCVSPIAKEVVVAALRVARNLNAPMVFTASLNQVDIDGGYTGWTPKSFSEFVLKEVGEGFNGMIFFEVDHCGPWLKDEHIARSYSYQEALDSVKKSIESFIDAGFTVFHIDTSLDIENTSRFANVEVAAKRAAELIDYVEDVAKSKNIEIIEYEIGSDRWNLNRAEDFDRFISLLIGMLKSKNINISKIVFAVADVGTKVKPNNRLDTSLALQFIKVTKSHKIYLKLHSGDYLENLSELPKIGIGGINIGPMFAHVMYNVVKEVVINSGKDYAIKLFEENIVKSITAGDRLGKYFTSHDKVMEDYRIGLASRYIWSKPEVREVIDLIGREVGVDIPKIWIDVLERYIENYLIQLNLYGLSNIFNNIVRK